MTYANRLRAAREREGLTQAQVAYRVGVCHTTVGAWERERQLPVGPHAEAVAKLLGVKPPVRDTSEPEPVDVDATYEPDLPAHPSDQKVIEEAARCCIAVAKSQGAYHGTTADDLVTAHVGEDMSRWKRLMTRVRNRARELESKVFDCKERVLDGEESA